LNSLWCSLIHCFICADFHVAFVRGERHRCREMIREKIKGPKSKESKRHQKKRPSIDTSESSTSEDHLYHGGLLLPSTSSPHHPTTRVSLSILDQQVMPPRYSSPTTKQPISSSSSSLLVEDGNDRKRNAQHDHDYHLFAILEKNFAPAASPSLEESSASSGFDCYNAQILEPRPIGRIRLSVGEKNRRSLR
jgi:hypothetical protein